MLVNVVAMIAFWVLVNIVLAYQLHLSGNMLWRKETLRPLESPAVTAHRERQEINGGKKKIEHATAYPGNSGDHSDQHSTNLEPEDSKEDSNSDVPPATPEPTASKKKKKKGGSDPLPSSIGNSINAAITPPVTVDDAGTGEITFFVIGDWGGPGREPQQNVAKAMDIIATSELPKVRRHVDFFVSTGDNMYEDGVSSVHDRRFRRNYEEVYKYPSQQARWYMSLGNHDHGAHGVMRDVQAEVNYTQISSRWYLPSTYYTQRLFLNSSIAQESTASRGADDPFLELFVIDTYDVSPRITRMTDKQVAWLGTVLAKSTATWKIVVGHRPLFSAGKKHGSSPYMQKLLKPLFAKYRVAAYLCGDDHELQVMQDDGVLYLLSGGGARAKKDLDKKIAQTVFHAGVHGFMQVSINASHMEVGVFNMRAEKLYTHFHPNT